MQKQKEVDQNKIEYLLHIALVTECQSLRRMVTFLNVGSGLALVISVITTTLLVYYDELELGIIFLLIGLITAAIFSYVRKYVYLPTLEVKEKQLQELQKVEKEDV